MMRRVADWKPNWDDLSPQMQEAWRGWAREVIAEIREPSEAMLLAGGDLLLDGTLEIETAEANARGVWRAMVDAMLAKPEEPT